MSVNGVQIKVGQTWRLRSDRTVRIMRHEPTKPFPWIGSDGGGEYSWRNDGHFDSVNGWPIDGPLDLVELLHDSQVNPLNGDDHVALTFGEIELCSSSGYSLFSAPATEPGTAVNPKDAIGSSKLPLHLWPAEATALGCIGMLEGMLKYGRNNFIGGEGVVASIYVDALYRHTKAWFEGEELTHDTKTDHLGNALASLAIIIKARAHGRLIDDRNFATRPNGERWREFIEQITPHVARLKAMFADKTPKHFTIADTPQFERKKADDTEGGAA